MTENALNELILYDNLIGKAVDEIVSLQSRLDNVQGCESRINPVAWYIEEVMGGRLPQETPAAGPWRKDIANMPNNVNVLILYGDHAVIGHLYIFEGRRWYQNESGGQSGLRVPDAWAEINTEWL